MLMISALNRAKISIIVITFWILCVSFLIVCASMSEFHAIIPKTNLTDFIQTTHMRFP